MPNKIETTLPERQVIADLDLANMDLNCTSHVSFSHEGQDVRGHGFAIERHGPRPSYEMCADLDRAVGIDPEDPENCRYPSTGLEPDRFIVLSDGRVLTDPEEARYGGGGERQLVEDSRVLARIMVQQEEDRQIRRARRTLVCELAIHYGGSAMAMQLFENAVWFNQGDPGEGQDRDGVKFWQVGRNSSHGFYMGVKKTGDSVEFFRAYYEPSYSDREDEWEQSQVTEFSGYYGHA